MTPTRPYFLRAMHDWILANNCTPYLSVDATLEGVEVPEAYVENGEITLNLSVEAIVDFFIDDSWVRFKAKFDGVQSEIFIPMRAVLGVYAKENGQGMMFPDEPAYHDAIHEEAEEVISQDTQPKKLDKAPSKVSHLKVIK